MFCQLSCFVKQFKENTPKEGVQLTMATMPDGPDAMPEVAMPGLKVLLSEEGHFSTTFSKPALLKLQLPIFFCVNAFKTLKTRFGNEKQTKAETCMQRTEC